MGGRSGYEYSYRFWADDDIIPLYRPRAALRRSTYLFEIRTNFKLKKADDQITMMLGSERFGARRWDDEQMMEGEASFRLKDDYGMSDEEIRSLVRDALGFAEQQRAADPRNAGLCLTGVVVELDFCTVQREGESANAAIDRAIKPESLIPLYQWPVLAEGCWDPHKFYMHRGDFLRILPMVRVEDEGGLALMEVCPICSRNSVIGAQITSLHCGHACHSLCLFRPLEAEVSASCPICRSLIPDDCEALISSCYEPSSSEESEMSSGSGF